MNPGFAEQHFKDALQAIRVAFGESWLNRKKAHPVRDLWKRNDPLASNELLWLGDSIMRLSKLNPRWIATTVDHIKSENRNERIGYVFELLALATCVENGQVVHLAPEGNPDYDADVELSTLEIYRFSLKNFGASTREGEFNKRCREIDTAILANSESDGLSWVGVALQADSYPKDSDWSDLASGIVAAMKAVIPARIGACWGYVPTPPPRTPHGLAVGQHSFSILIIAPHHANERKNFLDKIEQQCLTFNKAAASYDSTISAVPFIRLSEAAPVKYYEQWAREHLAQAGVNIDGIIFYQSSVVVDLKADTTSMHHYMNAVMKLGFSKPPLHMKVASGKIPGTPSRSVIAIGSREVDLSEHHWYQHRELFTLGPLADDGTGTGHMYSMPGSTTHAVMARPGEGGLILSPRQPSYGKLALFS